VRRACAQTVALERPLQLPRRSKAIRPLLSGGWANIGESVNNAPFTGDPMCGARAVTARLSMLDPHIPFHRGVACNRTTPVGVDILVRLGCCRLTDVYLLFVRIGRCGLTTQRTLPPGVAITDREKSQTLAMRLR
jgi:hypothetical protein